MAMLVMLSTCLFVCVVSVILTNGGFIGNYVDFGEHGTGQQ